MYKIGELSKLCRLPVKTLRFYDSEGLLVPDAIDRFTGYRYYSAARLSDCNRIIALKELGFSLDEIKRRMKAREPDDILALIDEKRAELDAQSNQIALRQKRLDSVRQIITEGEKNMFEMVIRNSDTMRFAAKRKIYDSKADAEAEITKIKNVLPKSILGMRSVIINYETEYREADLDLAACVEITGKFPKDSGYEDKTIKLSGDVAVLVCSTAELDDAYRSMTRQLEETDCQVIGAFYEIYHADGTVELKVPVYRPMFGDLLKDDESKLIFINDEEALGKWKLLDIVPSEEQFLYGHEKCKHGGWLDELYFLENGEAYWALGGWTRGIVQTVSHHIFNNRYTIQRTNGHTLLFLEMKHSYDGGAEKLAMPEIWVYEKESDRIYHADDIKRRDFVDYPFIPDESVLGEWKVKDFYCCDIDKFDPDKQNFPVNDLYFLKVSFLPDGTCIHLTKQHKSQLRWTKGYMLNLAQQIASVYEIRIIDGVEYVIVEWKTGDYVFGSDGKIYWYIFTRA